MGSCHSYITFISFHYAIKSESPQTSDIESLYLDDYGQYIEIDEVKHLDI